MPPKRGSGGPSVKTPTSPQAKRTRLSDNSTSQGVAVATTAATKAVTSTTAAWNLSVEDDPALMVDYNESTPAPSPKRGDEDSELMRHCNDDENLIAATAEVPVADLPDGTGVSQPRDNKAIHPSSKYGPPAERGTDHDELEQKPCSTTRDRVESKPFARRLEGGYGTRSIPRMPPPSEWPTIDGSTATLLARATLNAHDYFDIFHQWKSHGRTLGRLFPIPVVLYPMMVRGWFAD